MTPASASAPPVTKAVSARPARSSSSEAASESWLAVQHLRTASGSSASATVTEPVTPENSRQARAASSSVPTIVVARWRAGRMGGLDACWGRRMN
jgi:hypothetical protein